MNKPRSSAKTKPRYKRVLIKLSGEFVLHLADDLGPGGRVRGRRLLLDERVDLLVRVVVVQERRRRQEERRQVVVGVRVVREPAELVGGVDVSGAVLGVLRPLGGLEVDLEQAAGLQLVLDEIGRAHV